MAVCKAAAACLRAVIYCPAPSQEGRASIFQSSPDVHRLDAREDRRYRDIVQRRLVLMTPCISSSRHSRALFA